MLQIVQEFADWRIVFIRRYSPKNGRDVKFSLSLPSPVSEDNESEWQIKIQSTGLRPSFKQTMYGVDAIQALEVALVVLRTVEEKEGLELPED